MTNYKELRALCDAATDGKCSKTGIPYRDAIEEMRQMIADSDTRGSAADTPLTVRTRVLMDAIIELATATDPQTVRALIDEVERLRGALEFIANGCLVPPDGGSPRFEDAIQAAQQALKGTGHDATK